MPSTTDYNILTVISRENNAPATPYTARTYAAAGGQGAPAQEGRLAAVPGGVLVWAFGDHVPSGARLTFLMPLVNGSSTERLPQPVPVSLDPDGDVTEQKQKSVVYVLTVPSGVTSCDDGYVARVLLNGKEHPVLGPDSAAGAAAPPDLAGLVEAPGETGEIKVPPGSAGGGGQFTPSKEKAVGVGIFLFLLGAVVGLAVAGVLG